MKGPTNAETVGGTVGTDLKPIKIVNGVATPVANTLMDTVSNQDIFGVKSFKGELRVHTSETLMYLVTEIGSHDRSGEIRVSNGSNLGILYLTLDNDGTLKLQLGKVMNGSYSSTVVATL